MQHRGAVAFAAELHENCLGTRIGRLHRYAARCVDQQLRALGISMPQLEILSLLVLRDAPVRPSEIAQLLVAERSTVSRNLATLQQRGWVTAAQTSPTGRSMAVAVTTAGQSALADARAAWTIAQQTLTDALGPGSQTTIDAWLDRLVDPPA
jgi:DNA-binding MarR family transcriptional regulator